MDWLLNVVYGLEIVIGLGLLIFIHEAGHFLMAKRNGVRVEAFSLGMGPILWKRVWNGTEYRISAIPLGGYVKMAGENIGDPRTGAPDELQSKSAWQRLQIFAAGATMNLLIAFPIAILANLFGRSVHVPEIAIPGHPETLAGMKPGDTVVSVDGVPIESLEQYRKEMVRKSEGVMIEVRVRRGDEIVLLKVAQSGSERHAATHSRTTTIGAVRPDSAAWQAGLRAGHTVLAVDGAPVYTFEQVHRRLHGAAGQTIKLTVRTDDTPGAGSTLEATLAVPGRDEIAWPVDDRLLEARIKQVVAKTPGDIKINGAPFLQEEDVIVRVADARGTHEIKSWQDLKNVIEPNAGHPVRVTRKRGNDEATAEIVPMYGLKGVGVLGIVQKFGKKLAEVAPDSHWYRQGLRSGDEIENVEVLDKKGELVGKYGDVSVADLFAKRGERRSCKVIVVREVEKDKFERKTLDVSAVDEKVGDLKAVGLSKDDSGIVVGETQFVRKWSFGEAVKDGLWEPIDITVLTFQLLRKLVVRQESPTGLAGPVGIFQTSFLHAQKGFGNLLWLLVLITVNLGVFNVLPIPVLDGGHMLLLLMEKVRGQPPSPRFVNGFQLTGVVFLLMLIVFVTFNDISRF